MLKCGVYKITKDIRSVKSRKRSYIKRTNSSYLVYIHMISKIELEKIYSSNFIVKDIYVEVWGVQNKKRYSEHKVKKKKLYKKNKLKLFSVYPHDFTNIENKVDELKHLIS